jgi:hypothetical protein
MKSELRAETDSMGNMEVPAKAYYGAQTARAVENFPISDLRFPRSFIRALQRKLRFGRAKGRGIGKTQFVSTSRSERFDRACVQQDDRNQKSPYSSYRAQESRNVFGCDSIRRLHKSESQNDERTNPGNTPA